MKRSLLLCLCVSLFLVSGLPVIAADSSIRTTDDLALGGTILRDTVTNAGEGPGWTIHVRPGVRFSDRDRVVGYIDFLVPLYFTDRSVLFFNPKVSFDDRDDVEWNLGVGYRHLLLNEKLILGGNVFYDGRSSFSGRDYHQIGLGAEVLTEWVNGRVNGYISLSEAQEIDRWREYYFGPTSLNYSWAYRMEEPLSGLDYEVGFKVPGLSKYVETWVYGGGYTYFAEWTDDMVGWGGRIEVLPTDFLKVNFSVRDDNLRGTEYAGEVSLEIPFSVENLVAGKNPFAELGSRLGGSRTMKERLYEEVRRDVDIVAPVTDITRGTAPDQVIPGDPGEFEEMVYVDNRNTSPVEDGTLDHPWNTVAEGLADPRALTSTVFVFRGSGSYDEYVTLSDGVTLWGEGYDPYGMGFSGWAEINGPFGDTTDHWYWRYSTSHGIAPVFLASNCTIMGFDVRSENGLIGIFADSVTNVDIIHNRITETGAGIILENSSNVRIVDNEIETNGFAYRSPSSSGYRNSYPVYLAGASSNIEITNNQIRAVANGGTSDWSNAAGGILFTHTYNASGGYRDYCDVDGLIITGNVISAVRNGVNTRVTDDYPYQSFGIMSDATAVDGNSTRNFTISDNDITCTNGVFTLGISLLESENGTIYGNTFNGDGAYGRLIHSSYPTPFWTWTESTNWSGNYETNNDYYPDYPLMQAFFVSLGIQRNLTISDNIATIASDGIGPRARDNYGIYLGTSSGSSGVISGNRINCTGSLVNDAFYATDPTDWSITNNTFIPNP